VQLELDRLLALVRRELGAQEALVVEGDEEPAPLGPEPRPGPLGHELRCRMPDGRSVVARFETEPADREALRRRLEMLTSTFDALFQAPAPEGPGVSSHPPVASALQEELQALSTRAAALNAVVIDANSPVVWGAAHPQGLATLWPANKPEGAQPAEEPESETPLATVSQAAIDILRGLSDVAAVRKGKRVRYVHRGGTTPFVAHSFAGIYLLCVVYDAPFDELRAERAMIDSLPRVERLVLALPPFDPSPRAGSRAMARPRGR
jgi:hypothetical protein